MLYEFLKNHHDKIIARSATKISERSFPAVTEVELKIGISTLLDQLIDQLQVRAGVSDGQSTVSTGIATARGALMQEHGMTISQVVNDYGSLCQSITELAHESSAEITAQEFQALNLLLDEAIAEAVTEYSRKHNEGIFRQEIEHLGFFAHELRNTLSSVTIAFSLMQRGVVTPNGSTGISMSKSLSRLRDLIDRSLSEVRIRSKVDLKYAYFRLNSLIQVTLVDETGPNAMLETA